MRKTRAPDRTPMLLNLGADRWWSADRHRHRRSYEATFGDAAALLARPQPCEISDRPLARSQWSISCRTRRHTGRTVAAKGKLEGAMVQPALTGTSSVRHDQATVPEAANDITPLGGREPSARRRPGLGRRRCIGAPGSAGQPRES
jgi:hypothetical protein